MKNKWFIAYTKRTYDFDLSKMIIIEPEKGTYEADPFVVEHENRTYVFFEIYDGTKGRIGVRTINSDLYSPPTTVLERDTHLSFPHVFKYQNDWYMLPEQGMTGELILYKATEFPYRWTEHCVILKTVYADPVIHQLPGSFLLSITEGNDSILSLYESKTLDGDWQLVHRLRSDNQRNAGSYLDNFGELIRPVQIGQPTYGSAVLLKKVIKIKPYQEKAFKTIKPDWYPELTGCHTFNVSPNYIVTDGRICLEQRSL